MNKVSAGRFIELDDKRLVFVGDLMDKDGYGIGFRNANGEITKFALSADAATALVSLLTSPDAGTFTEEPAYLLADEPTETVCRWQVVVKKDEGASPSEC